MANAATACDEQTLWSWLSDVPDPEIPVLSVVDLGIVREVQQDGEQWVVTITPTYSGCPATQVIAADIERALRQHGLADVRIQTRIAPPWTTDWISQEGQRKLRDYGIAPPSPRVGALQRDPGPRQCPHCGSTHTALVSQFGSTPCKALYKCRDCLEPFDYFKCL